MNIDWIETDRPETYPAVVVKDKVTAYSTPLGTMSVREVIEDYAATYNLGTEEVDPDATQVAWAYVYDTAEARNAERPTTIYCALFSNGGQICGFGRA